MSSVKKVQEFHETFGHPVVKSPTIPSLDRCKLRISLLKEELKELEEAIENNDIVEAADAFIDLQYVLDGAILEFGLADIKCQLFDEVHRSNMSKAHETTNEAIDTITENELKGIKCSVNKVNGKYVVTRKSDNKVIKNIKYSPADLKSIIDAK